jgi:DNA-binding protein HU-beta
VKGGFAVNKKQMTHKISRDAGITALQAEKAYQSMLLGMTDALAQGERVTFSGFGSFEIKKRKARQGRNPKTGEKLRIPQKKRVKFNPSRILKDQL